jgi:hypothetical protein
MLPHNPAPEELRSIFADRHANQDCALFIENMRGFSGLFIHGTTAGNLGNVE